MSIILEMSKIGKNVLKGTYCAFDPSYLYVNHTFEF